MTSYLSAPYGPWPWDTEAEREAKQKAMAPKPTAPLRTVAEDEEITVPTADYRAIIRDNEALAGENCVLREENLSLRAQVARMAKQLEYVGR